VNRRSFLTGTLGAGAVTLGAPWLSTARAASEDDLAFANFGASTEFLVKDFYEKAIKAKVLSGPRAAALKRGRPAAAQHAKALVDTGRGVLRALLGAYQTAAASGSDESYRVLYTSLAASVSQQIVALAGVAAAEPFPIAMDLEAASDALEAYLG
jgi:hypothetical protein